MEILDGKKLSADMLAETSQTVKEMGRRIRLAIIVVGRDPSVEKFIAQKKKTAASVDIDVRIYPFEDSITTNELRKRAAEIVHEEKNTGVIIQLPLPPHINARYILNAVTPGKDVDMLSARAVGDFFTGKSKILPPVVGATKAFFETYRVDYKEKYIVIVGAGNLVGRPVALWLAGERATFSVIQMNTFNPEEFLRRADIIISGVGKPRFITGDLVKDGVVVIDAGTSESEGKLVGDVDFESVSKKASLLTPVPGGVGPVTVAVLFRNLVALARGQR